MPWRKNEPDRYDTQVQFHFRRLLDSGLSDEEILAQITSPGPEIEAQYLAYQEGQELSHAKWKEALQQEYKDLLTLENATGRKAANLLEKSRKRRGDDLEGSSPAKKSLLDTAKDKFERTFKKATLLGLDIIAKATNQPLVDPDDHEAAAELEAELFEADQTFGNPPPSSPPQGSIPPASSPPRASTPTPSIPPTAQSSPFQGSSPSPSSPQYLQPELNSPVRRRCRIESTSSESTTDSVRELFGPLYEVIIIFIKVINL